METEIRLRFGRVTGKAVRTNFKDILTISIWHRAQEISFSFP